MSLIRALEPEAMETAAEAAAYDAMDHAEANGAFVDRLLELDAAGLMLDLATGPGRIPLHLCDRLAAARVVGLDLSDAMLRIAQRRGRCSAQAGRLRWVRGDAKRLPFAGGAFDAVFSNTSLHHLPDPVPFLAEAWRVARPGAVLLVRDLYRPGSEARLRELVELHAAGATQGQRGLFADSLRAALTPQELAAAARRAGWEGFELVVDTDRHMSLQCRRG